MTKHHAYVFGLAIVSVALLYAAVFQMPAWGLPSNSQESPAENDATTNASSRSARFVEVKFKEHLRVRLYSADTASGKETKAVTNAAGVTIARARFKGLTEADASHLLELLRSYSVRAIIPRVSEDETDRIRKELGPDTPDMGSWYIIALPSDADVPSFIAALKQLNSVDNAVPAIENIGF